MFQLFRFFAVVVRKIDIFLLDAVGKKWSSEVFIIFASFGEAILEDLCIAGPAFFIG